jgi:hypothetical protein
MLNTEIQTNSLSPSTPCCSVKSTCCTTKKETDSLQKIVDTTCRVALGIISAICAPLQFALSFIAGFFAGSVYEIKYQSPFADADSKPVCAQGYMDFLSGTRFPPPMVTLATAAFIAEHTCHHPQFYSPFCGLFLGFWVGRHGADYARDLVNYAFTNLGKVFIQPC